MQAYLPKGISGTQINKLSSRKCWDLVQFQEMLAIEGRPDSRPSGRPAAEQRVESRPGKVA